MLSMLQLKLLAGGIALLLLVGAVWSYGSWQHQRGKQAGESAQLAVSQQQLAAQEQRFQAVLAELREQQQLLVEELRQSNAREQILAGSIASLQSQRAQVPIVVQALPDSAVKADIEMKLGGPLENPDILRKADVLVTEHPLLKAENEQLGQQVAEIRKQVGLQEQRVTNLEAQRDATLSAYDVLKQHYVQAYNVAQQPKRKWYCLWLCSAKQQLPFPAPNALGDPLAKLGSN